MSTAIGVLDREGWDQRTDILVVVNPMQREVLWVPRDLYCETHRHRINHAFGQGGHELLQAALREHGIPIDHSICVMRSAVEQALLDYSITVPVPEPQEFYYPLVPQEPIENGQKIVRFTPPAELLEGERFHQWMGASVPFEGYTDATRDLIRIARQQVLLRRLLEEEFDFSRMPLSGLRSSSLDAFTELAQVKPDWRFQTLSGMVPVTIRKMYVFISKSAAATKLQPHAEPSPQHCLPAAT